MSIEMEVIDMVHEEAKKALIAKYGYVRGEEAIAFYQETLRFLYTASMMKRE